MKKTYEAPSVEKIAFMYRDQVVVASGGARCHVDWVGDNGYDAHCTTDGIFHGDQSPV